MPPRFRLVNDYVFQQESQGRYVYQDMLTLYRIIMPLVHDDDDYDDYNTPNLSRLAEISTPDTTETKGKKR